MYAPAEVNNRAMRPVGYEKGWLPEAAMAYHVYCIVGTDGDGPTNPILKELCHFNDGFTMKQREKDLRRLQTAGFVTEFGAVNPVPTGLAEVEFVLDQFDSMDPPTSWAFWDYGELTGHNATQVEAYLRTVARAYPRAVSGELKSMHFDARSSSFKMEYQAISGGETELFLPVQRRYSDGFRVTSTPPNVLTIRKAPYGINLIANSSVLVAVEITANAAVQAITFV